MILCAEYSPPLWSTARSEFYPPVSQKYRHASRFKEEYHLVYDVEGVEVETPFAHMWCGLQERDMFAISAFFICKCNRVRKAGHWPIAGNLPQSYIQLILAIIPENTLAWCICLQVPPHTKAQARRPRQSRMRAEECSNIHFSKCWENCEFWGKS